MIDPDGYRPNVGIIIAREGGELFWGRRINRDGWQFPQGGMRSDETPLEAMYRELQEETGLGGYRKFNRPFHAACRAAGGRARTMYGAVRGAGGGFGGRQGRRGALSPA
ncbi:MAG: NUDIX domain-containing protein, partial [Xanthomonadaceae bacterium]|nr:NUDIX domain-containing protein [Xanthomonadaceae bacterium]